LAGHRIMSVTACRGYMDNARGLCNREYYVSFDAQFIATCLCLIYFLRYLKFHSTRNLRFWRIWTI